MNSQQLEAGPKLDALVAEHVMGSAFVQTKLYLPPYSTDIAAVWEVVEKMGYRPFDLLTSLVASGPVVEGKIPCRWEWFCYFDDGARAIQAETAPLAICRAALLACPRQPDKPDDKPQHQNRGHEVPHPSGDPELRPMRVEDHPTPSHRQSDQDNHTTE